MLQAMLAAGALKDRLEAVCRLLPQSFGVNNFMALLTDVYRQKNEDSSFEFQRPKSDSTPSSVATPLAPPEVSWVALSKTGFCFH